MSELRDCDKYERCPLCKALFEIQIPAPWILSFCKGGRFDECQRFETSKAGNRVPITLLPDGTSFTGETATRLRTWATANGVG